MQTEPDSTREPDISDNYKAYMFLKGLGFPVILVRKAIVSLSGFNQTELAKVLSIERNVLGMVISGIRSPKNIQKKIIP